MTMQKYVPFAVLSLTMAQSLFAQDKAVTAASINMPASLAQSDRVKVNGWDNYLNLGITGNLTDNHKVVGKTEGQATTFGSKIEGALDLKEQDREWLNSLNLLLSYNRTPQLARYTKADDTLELESLYKSYFSARSGSFVRANIDTSLVEGSDERDAEVTYLIRKGNGETQTLTTDSLKLTDGLRPLKVRESLGIFTNLAEGPLFKMDLKAGVGLRQVLAKGQRVIADDAATKEIEVDQLRDSSKAGYELGTEVGGATEDKRVTYKVSFNALFPFYETPDDGKTGSTTFAKRVLDLNGKLSFKLSDWASLDYNYKMVRDPSILQEAQVSQSFLFSVNQVLAARKS